MSTVGDAAATLLVFVGDDRTRLVRDAASAELPFGSGSLSREICGDPPQPEELTNAIGLVADHLDDLAREVPALAPAGEVRVHGSAIAAIAAVELGTVGTPDIVRLERAAAEEVFRTLATEARADRRLNPGLAPDLVHEVVGACCVLVALMRSLHLDVVDLATGAGAATGADAEDT